MTMRMTTDPRLGCLSRGTGTQVVDQSTDDVSTIGEGVWIMAMSRKDYRAFAEVLNGEWRAAHESDNGHVERPLIMAMASGMAAVFRVDNNRFDRQRWMDAVTDLTEGK